MVAVPELVPLAALLFAAALTLVAVAIIKGLFRPLTGLPLGIGSVIGGLLDTATQALTNFVGLAVQGAEKIVGLSFHEMARLVDWIGSEIVKHAVVLEQLATLVGRQLYSVTGLRALVNDLTRTWHGIEQGVRTLTKEYHGIEGRLRTLERDLAKGIGHDLRVSIRALDKELAHVENSTIPAIREAEQSAAASIDNLYAWARGKAALIGVGTFAYAISVAIGVNAWKMIRCAGFGNFWNTRKCGLWSDLEGLLALFADTFLLTNICDLLPFLETAVSDVADPLVVGLTDIGAGLCSGGIGPAPILAVPALSLPANPGVTLNLP